ncbi:laccase [Lindgomyces ingoldianus]|uniref:Laccase n=1 Tax=Lindgomyces ingoldianus TaxID=673940 RepID=A0ACB6R7P3_9PLEO|nr:laccase [Lindgomyces ingoldianus]KAF2475269.1 laccase [Lindgomyces ingoldianus]
MESGLAKILIVFFLASFAAATKVTETLRLTWENGAPNGQSRNMIFTNGGFPGPNLIFDEGDEVEITVHNDMPRNASVHWHGLEQTRSPWSDGVSGLSQTPILPGKSFVYRFTASPTGTHWYHSHEQMSMFDGLYGGIFIRPKKDCEAPWPFISDDTRDTDAMARAALNPELVMLSDWSQYTSDEYWKANVDSGLLVFCVDSILANGQGAVYCPSQEFLIDQTAPGIKDSAFKNGEHVTDKGCFPFTDAIEGGTVNTSHPETIPASLQEGCIPSTGSNATIEVDPAAGWVSFNFIAASTQKQVLISIDEHPMWIYEVDGHWVKPKEYLSAAISAGERFSAMVKLDKPPGTYTIRLPDSGSTQVISGFANLVYKGSNSTIVPKPYVTYGGFNATIPAGIQTYTPWDLPTDIMPPFPPIAPRPGAADEEYLLVMGRLNSSIGYTVNTKYLYPMTWNADTPLLFYPDRILPEEDGYVIRTQNGSWVDLILQVSTLSNDLAAFTHVMHKHGSKTWRVGMGPGIWNYSSVTNAMAEHPEFFNMEDPGYRDTWLTTFSPVPEGGWWIVLRYQATNPGPWLFHCHIELHAMGGMAMAILDGVDEWPEVPDEYQL